MQVGQFLQNGRKYFRTRVGVVPAYPAAGAEGGVCGHREWHGSCSFAGRTRPGTHKS